MGIFNKKNRRISNLVTDIYRAVAIQARQLMFFRDYELSDTPFGRFEVLTLHLALILRRLKIATIKEKEATDLNAVAQLLCNWVVADVEESLRSMPISELKINRYLKMMIEGFYGRLIAYDKALELNDKGMLEQAVYRNVYGEIDSISGNIVKGLVVYIYQTWELLQEMTIDQIIIHLKEKGERDAL